MSRAVWWGANLDATADVAGCWVRWLVRFYGLLGVIKNVSLHFLSIFLLPRVIHKGIDVLIMGCACRSAARLRGPLKGLNPSYLKRIISAKETG